MYQDPSPEAMLQLVIYNYLYKTRLTYNTYGVVYAWSRNIWLKIKALQINSRGYILKINYSWTSSLSHNILHKERTVDKALLQISFSQQYYVSLYKCYHDTHYYPDTIIYCCLKKCHHRMMSNNNSIGCQDNSTISHIPSYCKNTSNVTISPIGKDHLIVRKRIYMTTFIVNKTILAYTTFNPLLLTTDIVM